MNPQSLLFSVISTCCFLQQLMPTRGLGGLAIVVAAKQDQGFRKPACEVPCVSRTISCFYFRGSESLVAGCYYLIYHQLVHLQPPGNGFLMRMEALGLQCETQTAAVYTE